MEPTSTLSIGKRSLRLRLRSVFGVVDEAKGRWRRRRRVWLLMGALLSAFVLVASLLGALEAISNAPTCARPAAACGGTAMGTIRGTVVTYSLGSTFPPANSTITVEQKGRVVGRLLLGPGGGFTFVEPSGTYVLALSGHFCTGRKVVVRSGESSRVWVHCALPVAAPTLKKTNKPVVTAQPLTSSQ
jgi:hypothetical protein